MCPLIAAGVELVKQKCYVKQKSLIGPAATYDCDIWPADKNM